MDYEKLHKDTIAKLQEMVNSGKITVKTACGICADFVPESEDERIRKELLNAFQESEDSLYMVLTPHRRELFITWLEAQGKQKPDTDFSDLRTWKYIADAVLTEWNGIGQYLDDSRTETIAKKLQKRFGNIEQKPTDKVELKFKIGDWLVSIEYGNIVRVLEVLEDFYRLDFGEDTIGTLCTELVDSDYRLWDITKDAKDGDVLCCESGWTCIFKALDNHTNTFSSYCFMDNDKWFCNTGNECHTLDKAFIKAYNGEIHPATKEQREQLEKAMADAGYKWNKEKLKLEKIEPKKEDTSELTPFEAELFSMMSDAWQGYLFGEEVNIAKIVKEHSSELLERANEQKPLEYSLEQAAHIFLEALSSIPYNNKPITDAQCVTRELLKFLSNASTYNPDALNEQDFWSEEDETILNNLIWALKEDMVLAADRDTYASWLKFLKERYTWRPSNEQMKILNEVLNFAANHESPHWNDYIFGTLNNLIRQLKKLMEE